MLQKLDGGLYLYGGSSSTAERRGSVNLDGSSPPYHLHYFYDIQRTSTKTRDVCSELTIGGIMGEETTCVSFYGKFCIWLRWNLYILGTAFVCFIGYAIYFGTPSCLKTVDSQILQSRVEKISEAMDEMEDFKTVVALKLEKKK